jgi:hypothetical protein
MTYEEKTLWSGDFLFFSQHVKKESKQTQAKVLDEWLAAANYLKPDMWSNVDDVSEGLTQKDILEFRSFILSNGSSLTKSLFQKNCSTAMPRPEPAETRDLKKLHIFDYQSAECSSIDNTAFKYAAAIIDSKFDEHCAYRDLYSKLELRCARNGATHEFAISSRPEICEESKTDLSLRKKRENQAKNTEPQEENPAHFPSVAPSNTSVPSSATKVP